jgi:hypothetical protein
MGYFSFALFGLYVLTMIVSCVIATRNRSKKHLKVIRLLLYYSTTYSIVNLILQATKSKTLYFELCNLDAVIEISFIYFYFRSVMIRENLRIAIFTLYLIFIGLSIFLWLGPPQLFKLFIAPFYGTTNLFIIVPCFFYFYEIFRSDLETNYRKDSNFYIISAIFFVYGVTMPFYFGYNTIFSLSRAGNEILGDINCFIWICFFIALSIAFTLPTTGNNKMEVEIK